eukprot:scaffold327_cov58-Phaeocystis_antarctica.AAC.2
MRRHVRTPPRSSRGPGTGTTYPCCARRSPTRRGKSHHARRPGAPLRRSDAPHPTARWRRRRAAAARPPAAGSERWHIGLRAAGPPPPCSAHAPPPRAAPGEGIGLGLGLGCSARRRSAAQGGARRTSICSVA